MKTLKKRNAKPSESSIAVPFDDIFHDKRLDNNDGNAVGVDKTIFNLRVSLSDSIKSPIVQIVICLGILIACPVAMFGYIPGTTVAQFCRDMWIGWDGLLHSSSICVAAGTLFGSFFCGPYFYNLKKHSYVCPCDSSGDDDLKFTPEEPTKNYDNCKENRAVAEKTFFKVAMIITQIFCFCTAMNAELQVVTPSWILNPFLLLNFKVHRPSDVARTLETDNVCLAQQNEKLAMDELAKLPVFKRKQEKERLRQPLCLSEDSWTALSAGMLSSRNENDVSSVLKGADYVLQKSGGIIVNAMCRDCADALPDFIQNVENIHAFFPKLSVVIFENDSEDGSRDIFKEWAKKDKAYEVDLMECEEAVDCIFGESHRYDSFEAEAYYNSSAVGKMAAFRNRIVDYVRKEPKYEAYSHMLVMDLDLGVSISPLGMLHTLGEVPDNPVASSGRQTWPGSFGTLRPPYDFSAFRADRTEDHQHLRGITDWVCKLMPAGDRWKNMCHISSPAHMILVLMGDRGENDIWRVNSAFNGATLYPMELIKAHNPRYDIGDDGQRCEHISFNRQMERPMFVNRKWSFNIIPTQPGGPTGLRALRGLVRILFIPKLVLSIYFQGFVFLMLFCFAIMRLGILIVYPLFAKTVNAASFGMKGGISAEKAKELKVLPSFYNYAQ